MERYLRLDVLKQVNAELFWRNWKLNARDIVLGCELKIAAEHALRRCLKFEQGRNNRAFITDHSSICVFTEDEWKDH